MPHPQTRPTHKTKKRLAIALAVLAALFALATALLVFSGLNDKLGHADAALVLGSKVEPDGTPSPRLRARLDRTIELYGAGYFPFIIVSGGTGKEGFDEAVVMQTYLRTKGIPPDRIFIDNRGTTTFMSARNTLQIARPRSIKSVLVISQYFHIPRSRLALKRFGISTVYTAHAHYFEARDIYSTVRELFGYISYLFRDYDPNLAQEAEI
jgi:vancomycin permeability regulator SanA